MPILILAEYDNKRFTPEFFRVLNAARQLQRQVDLLIVGDCCDSLLAYASDMLEVNKIIVAKHHLLADQAAERVSVILAELAHAYTHILSSTSAPAKQIFPRTSALLQVEMLTKVNRIYDDKTFGQTIFSGRVAAEVQLHEKIKLLLVDSSAFEPAPLNRSSDAAWPEIIEYCYEENTAIRCSQIVQRSEAESNAHTLQSAEIVVGIGRGLVSCQADIDLVQTFAARIGAALGATRAVVDAGWLPADKQIGQTAKTIAPRLYLALGISGATQHIAGIKNSQIIVAVNKDPEAPIFEVADFALLGDLKLLMPELYSRFTNRSEAIDETVPESFAQVI